MEFTKECLSLIRIPPKTLKRQAFHSRRSRRRRRRLSSNPEISIIANGVQFFSQGTNQHQNSLLRRYTHHRNTLKPTKTTLLSFSSSPASHSIILSLFFFCWFSQANDFEKGNLFPSPPPSKWVHVETLCFVCNLIVPNSKIGVVL